LRKSLQITLAKFLGVGLIGFTVDLVGLQWLLWMGYGPVVARSLTFPLAVLVTWALHRQFTFAHRRSDKRTSELTKYLSGQIAAALTAFGAYTWLVLQFDLFNQTPAYALIVSSVIGTTINYLSSHFVVFNNPNKSD